MLTNSTASFKDGTAIVSGRDKNQVAGLELKETMILCRRAAQTTHIKSIAVFFHPMEQIEVASGKVNMVTVEAEFTRLESELSFLQVRSTMTLQETIRQVKAEMRGSQADPSHEAGELAGAENPYSLMQVFGRGHQVTRNGATVYVTRCQATEVLPRTHTNCTNETPLTCKRLLLLPLPLGPRGRHTSLRGRGGGTQFGRLVRKFGALYYNHITV